MSDPGPILFLPDENGDSVWSPRSGAVWKGQTIYPDFGESRCRRAPDGWIDEAVERIHSHILNHGAMTKEELRSAILGPPPEPEPEEWMRAAVDEICWNVLVHDPAKYRAEVLRIIAKHARRKP